MANYRFIVVTVSAVVGMLGTARLGVWQLDRAAQKIALQTALDDRGRLPPLATADLAATPKAAEPQHYRPAVLRGRWDTGHTVFLDNRQIDGKPGFFVLTPLVLEGRTDAVVVQRGWTPRNFTDRTVLPAVPTPTGVVAVTGTIAPPPSRLFEFAASASGPIRQNLDLAGFSKETRLNLLPMSVLETGSADDGLSRRWPRPAVDVQKHYGYAFQWFALSALMAGLYVWFQLVRPRLRHPAR